MRRPTTLLLCSEALAQLQFAAFTRRALRPGHVACGDHCVRGTLPPRHHAGTNDLLSKALDATGRKAAFAPRHYRIPPPGDMPRKATSAASGRRPVVTGTRAEPPPSPRRQSDARRASRRPRAFAGVRAGSQGGTTSAPSTGGETGAAERHAHRFGSQLAKPSAASRKRLFTAPRTLAGKSVGTPAVACITSVAHSVTRRASKYLSRFVYPATPDPVPLVVSCP